MNFSLGAFLFLLYVSLWQCSQAKVDPVPRDFIILDEHFTGDLQRYKHSIDACYDTKEGCPSASERVKIVAAPDTAAMKAVRFEVTGEPSAFRAELSLPAEEGRQERWFAEKIYLPEIYNGDTFLVMQWHAQMGDKRVDRDFPNLAIHSKGGKWVVTQAFGDPANIQRKNTDGPAITAKHWNKMSVHVKWSEGNDGFTQVWINNQLVLDQKGMNIYTGLERRSPYFKTGIYCPARKALTTVSTPLTAFAADLKIGNEKATAQKMK